MDGKHGMRLAIALALGLLAAPEAMAATAWFTSANLAASSQFRPNDVAAVPTLDGNGQVYWRASDTADSPQLYVKGSPASAKWFGGAGGSDLTIFFATGDPASPTWVEYETLPSGGACSTYPCSAITLAPGYTYKFRCGAPTAESTSLLGVEGTR